MGRRAKYQTDEERTIAKRLYMREWQQRNAEKVRGYSRKYYAKIAADPKKKEEHNDRKNLERLRRRTKGE